MKIQRQYSLPNCTLILEGLSDTTTAGNSSDPRPLMSILMNAECYFLSQGEPLSGGREFFESLVKAVSRYAQECLSGVHPVEKHPQADLVQLQKMNGNLHRLTMQIPADSSTPEPQAGGTGTSTLASVHVDLTTVQLFDLVEAIDQFLADPRTLPDLSAPLVPVSKRQVRTGEPVAKQVVPATLGVSSLALAAIAFFFVPIPEIRKPEPTPKPATSGALNSSSTSPSTPVAASPPPPQATPDASPQISSVPTPANSPEASPSPSPSPAATPEAVLAPATEITNPAQLQALEQKLYSQVNQAWKTEPNFTQKLIYRVGVSKEGAILGYKPVNQAALDDAKQTPLFNLVDVAAANKTSSSEPKAQFKVVFTPSGVLEVSPWYGYPPDPAASPKPGTNAEITDSEQLKSLASKLYDQLDKNWKGSPSFEKDLLYRVKLNPEGVIAAYEPLNQPASDYTQAIPLPKLVKASQGTQEPVGLFKVVFKPNGVLQVSPWRGY